MTTRRGVEVADGGLTGPRRPTPGAARLTSGAESVTTVVVALVANVAIAATKTGAALLTGSASMVAEAAHSWADSGNEVLLLVAGRRSRRPPDADHPLGYGREAYFWSLLAAVALFGVGAGVGIVQGVPELRAPEPAQHYLISYAVLGVAFVLEAVSFRRSVGQARRSLVRPDDSVLRYVLRTSDPTLRAVFFEDAAALVALVIAFAGILAHQLTGSATPDAVGSILVGVVLGVVALGLIGQNRRFLVGVVVDPGIRDTVLSVLHGHPAISRVTYLYLTYLGPGSVLLVAAVDLVGDEAEHTVAATLRALSGQLEQDPRVLRAVLTLALPEDPTLTPYGPTPGG